MKIHHLNCGTMCPAASPLVGGKGGWFDRGEMVCHCLLIETDADGLVLVDTGFGTGDVKDPSRFSGFFRTFVGPRFDANETALAHVRRLGLDPNDVRHIVLTHLDLDHGGGMADFPWARVHLHGVELRAAQARATLMERERYRPIHWAHDPKWQAYEDQGDDWFGIRAIRKLEGLSAEIALVPLFGHSRGHSGVAVKDGDRWLLHAGDAYFHHGELELPRRCPPALDAFQKLVQFDAKARWENSARLGKLHREKQGWVSIFSAHDPVELARYQG